MRVAHLSVVGRRFAVMSEIGRRLDTLDKRHTRMGLPPISTDIRTDTERLDHIRGMVNGMQIPLSIDGETQARDVYMLGAQVVAWLIALEERDEGRLP